MKTDNELLLYFKSPYRLVEKFRQRGKLGPALLINIAGSTFNGFAAPLINYLVNRNEYKITLNLLNMVGVFIISMLTYFAACGVLWVASHIFGGGCSYREVLATWGLSYIPTILCYAVVITSECLFYYFIGNTLLLLLINTIFLLLLIWKAIFYFIEARAVLGLRGSRLAAATLVTGLLFAVLIFADMHLGLMLPML
jgi:hypothetical protein